MHKLSEQPARHAAEREAPPAAEVLETAAAPEAAAESLSLEEQAVRLLEKAGRAMLLAEIVEAMAASSLEGLNRHSAAAAIGAVCRRGKIKRLEKGVYARLGFDENRYESIRTPSCAKRVQLLFEKAARPLALAEIRAGLEDDDWGGVSGRNLLNQLNNLCSRGELLHLGREFYAGPGHVAGDGGFVVPLPLNERITELIGPAGGPLPIREIIDGLEEDGFDEAYDPRHVRNGLARLSRSGRLKRLEKGVYAGPEFESAAYTPSASPTLEARVVRLLEASQEPLSKRDIEAGLVEDGFGPFRAASADRQISKSVRRGVIQRVAYGYYARPDFEADCFVNPKSLTSRTVFILEKAGRPLFTEEIAGLLNDDGLPAARRSSVISSLSKACKAGLIRRMDPGIYASNRLASYSRPVRKTSIEGRLLTLLAAAEPMSSAQISRGLAADGLRQVKEASVHNVLSQACRQGRIRRRSEGRYAIRPATERDWLPADEFSQGDIVVCILELAATPLDSSEIRAIFGAVGFGEVKPVNLDRLLSTACLKGRIERLKRGTYARLGYREEPDKLGEDSLPTWPRPSLDSRIAAAVAGGPLTCSEIRDRLNGDGLKAAGAGSVRSRLSACQSRGRLKRLRRGLYALPDFEGEVPPDARLQARVKRVLAAAAEPLARSEIADGLKKDGLSGFSASGLDNALAAAVDDGQAWRPEKGVYADNDFRGPHAKKENKRSGERKRARSVRPAAKKPPASKERPARRAGQPAAGKESPARTGEKRPSAGRKEPASKLNSEATAGPGPRAAAEEKNKLAPTARQRVNGALEGSGQPLTLKALTAAVNADGFRSLTNSSVSKQAAELCRQASAKRLEQGVYAAASFDESLYRSEAEILQARIGAILEASQRIMSLDEIVRELDGDGGQAVKPAGARRQLQAMHKDKRIKKPAPGKYAHPAVRLGIKNPSAQPTIGRKTARIINFWGGDVTLKEIKEELAEAGFQNLDQPRVDSLIASILERKQRFMKR